MATEQDFVLTRVYKSQSVYCDRLVTPLYTKNKYTFLDTLFSPALRTGLGTNYGMIFGSEAPPHGPIWDNK